ncbi:MAG: DNA internalization-related competence protein ComEC/Rec2 [Neisseria sp.]|nr:DNA internalization-related competence protein ComEC/Rec2 [Neisseria sp.]
MMKTLMPAAWVAGVLASFALPAVPAWGWWAGVLAVLALLILRVPKLAWLGVFVLAAAYGVWRTQLDLAEQWPLNRNQERVAAVVRVASLLQQDDKRVSFLADVETADGKSWRLSLSDYERRSWAVGSRWQTDLKVRAAIGEHNPRGLNREAWALAQGIDGFATVGKTRYPMPSAQGFEQVADGIFAPKWWVLPWREQISLNWQQLAGKGLDDGVALMRALSIGEQNALRNELWQAFRPLGLNHLISISGLHVTMVALLAAYLTHQILRRVRVNVRRPRVWQLSAGVAAALFYAALAGFAVPTLRTVFMAAVLAWAWLGRQYLSAWQAWFWALAAVLLLDPSATLAVGTWLSFGMVGVLLWSSAHRLEEWATWKTALRGQIAASWATLLGAGFLFAAVPVFSPLVNAVAIPWFSWLLVPLALLASAIPVYPVQYAAAFLAEYTLRVLLWLAQWTPEWSVVLTPLPLFLLSIIAVLLLVLPRGTTLKPWAIIVLLGFMFYPKPRLEAGQLRVQVIDVGQGLAVLLQTQNRHLLFDTGTAAAAQTQTVPTLRASGVQRLDGLILSHHDSDHDGGASQIVQDFMPSAVWFGQEKYAFKHLSASPKLCHHSPAWTWDGVHFEFLTLPDNRHADDNEQSCVLRVVAGGAAVLITGDLSRKGELALLKSYGDSLYSQVLLLGHHGSSSSSDSRFLNAVNPIYAIASSGFANPYRHPNQSVIDALKAHQIQLKRTDLQGIQTIELLGSQQVQLTSLPKRFYWQRKPFE